MEGERGIHTEKHVTLDEGCAFVILQEREIMCVNLPAPRDALCCKEDVEILKTEFLEYLELT
jgi:hypothetical protein